jgi:tyrosinase
MKFFALSTMLAVAGSVSGLPQSVPSTPLAPLFPIEKFKTGQFARLLSLEDVLNGVFIVNATDTSQEPNFDMSVTATCSNPRVRQEWDSYSDGDRQAFINAIRCLQGRPPSGQFSQSKSRYEDFVALHQTLTPNIHSRIDRLNAKFLVWHRYYLWTFEDILRSECGFDRSMPWFDETRYAGRFAQSSVFSSQWFGGVNGGNKCITDGVSVLSSISKAPLISCSNSRIWSSTLVPV